MLFCDEYGNTETLLYRLFKFPLFNRQGSRSREVVSIDDFSKFPVIAFLSDERNKELKRSLAGGVVRGDSSLFE
jgi:hypothetical protein